MAVTYVCSINSLALATVAQCFLCGVSCNLKCQSDLLRAVAYFWLQKPQFDPRTVHVKFMAEKVAPGKVFLPVFRFSPVSSIPPLLYTHLHFALNTRTHGRSLGTFQNAVLFGNQVSLIKKNIHFSAVSRWPLTSETPVRSQGTPIKFMMNKVILGQFFVWVLRFFHCQYHSTNVPRSSHSTRWFYLQEKRAKPGNLPKKQRPFGYRGELDRYFESLKC
jgi:hypothetical protein